MSEPEQGGAQEGVASEQFPCPKCGSSMLLDPESETLKCQHCGHATGIETEAKPIVEYDFKDALARLERRPARDLAPEAKEVSCKNCGARTVVTGHATRCPFCDSPVVVDPDSGAVSVVPESLLPHHVTRDQADDGYRKWIRSRWFAPSDLSVRAMRDGLDGVYLPYWTFDSRTSTHYRGLKGEYYYVTTGSGQNKKRERRTRWWPRSGSVRKEFDDILICASKALPAALVQELEPWDLEELKAFDSRFLSGFAAERYSLDLEQAFPLAEDRMEPEIRSLIRRQIGGDTQRILWMKIEHQDIRFKHLLLPVWISSFRYQAKPYRVLVNARTGEIQGERPWSWAKILAAVGLVLAVILAAVILANAK